MLLAGDWNIGTWWSGEDVRYARREGAALALIRAYGLIDCFDRFRERGRLAGCGCDFGDDCRHIRTFKKPGSDAAYMDDYVFATEALAERITSARVADGWDWNTSLSDHAPLIVDIA